MVLTKFNFWQIITQKNVLVTALVFLIGLALQLADTTLIFLVIGTGTLATWWCWRPMPPNAESQLILDTLRNYPAVVIKNHPHTVAFNSSPSLLAAAYQSPVPDMLLKRVLLRETQEMEGIQLSVSRSQLDTFLLLQCPLTPFTEIKRIVRAFQNIIDLFELQIQVRFQPAERYQTLRLFGLDQHLSNTETRQNVLQSELQRDKTQLINMPTQESHISNNTSNIPHLGAEKHEKTPFVVKI